MSILILFPGCQSEVETTLPPNDLIEQQEFTEIIADLFLIEGLRSMHTTAEHKELNPTEAYYNGVWKSREVSQDRFIRSFEYYKKNRQLMEVIYSEAAKIIKRQEDEMKKGTTLPQD